MELSIVIPVYNEEMLLAEVVRGLLERAEHDRLTFEVILVENGSTDCSPRIADELALADLRIRVIHLEQADYGKALRLGYLGGAGNYLANFSVDWVDLEFLRVALSKLDSCDIAMALKHSVRSCIRRPWLLQVGGMVFHALVRVLFRLPFADTHGIMVLRRQKVIGLLRACRFGGEMLETELVIRAHRAGLRICEVPVEICETRRSRIGALRRAFRGSIQLGRLWIAMRREVG